MVLICRRLIRRIDRRDVIRPIGARYCLVLLSNVDSRARARSLENNGKTSDTSRIPPPCYDRADFHGGRYLVSLRYRLLRLYLARLDKREKNSMGVKKVRPGI